MHPPWVYTGMTQKDGMGREVGGEFRMGNTCTLVVEKTLESPLDCKEIQQVYPKGNQSWIFIGRTDAEAETPILWPPDVKNSLEKTLMLGKIEGRKRRERQRMRWLDGMTNSCHPTHGHEFEQASGVGDGQGSLTCCHPWDCKQLDMTEWLNWLIILLFYISEVQHEPHQAKIEVLAGFGSFLESLEENFLAFFSF